jgi:glucose-1-phosphate thymidylyltransferase
VSRSIRKAVVLAAGRGTRMQRPDARARLDPRQAAAADLGAKGMVPIHGRPFLDYVISALADSGIEDVCLVTPTGDGPIREHYRALAPERVRLVFAMQAEPRGSADALLPAEEFVDSEDFLALNSDNLYPVSALRALRELDGPGLPVFERERLLATSNFTRERVGAFATLRVSADGILEGILEKADDATGSPGGRVLLSMNLWRFSPRIFEACRRVPLSSRGERELPQAVQWAIDNLGERLRAVPCAEGVLDLTARSDVAALEAML